MSGDGGKTGGRARTRQHAWRAGFLEVLASGKTVSQAAKAVGVSRSRVYAARAEDVEFAAAWVDAYEQGTDVLVEEARRRAVEGVRRPIMYRGEVVEEVREYSDALLLALLKARRPEEYRERQDIRHSGAVGVAPLTAEELSRIRELGQRADLEPAFEALGAALMAASATESVIP